MRERGRIWGGILTILIAGWLGVEDLNAQRYGRRGHRERTVPGWDVDPFYKADVFTFVRIRYSSYRSWGWGGQRWDTDWPDADWNFSYRLQELTSLKVDPQGKIKELTDPDLDNYPFIYIVEPGALHFLEPEVVALRRYLLNGGFLMFDDFWGDEQLVNVHREMKRVFPEKTPEELSIDHPIFRIVFPLDEKPQIPAPPWMYQGYERDGRQVHYQALYDDHGRMMVIICHNTDLGDGWEEEAINPEYFHMYSEKKAYPMGINIVIYALTH